MKEWILREDGYDQEKIPEMGNRYLVGNGLIGIRGTLEEYKKTMLPAINLAGVYDRVNDWREPINLPNGCYGYLRVDGERLALPEAEPLEHYVELDYHHGIFRRDTVFQTSRGQICLRSERFASMVDPYLYAMRFQIQADFHADVEFVTGFDGDVWDLNGPHLEEMETQGDVEGLYISARTHEENILLEEAEAIRTSFHLEEKILQQKNKILHRIFFVTMPGDNYTIDKLVTIRVHDGTENPWNMDVKEHRGQALQLGYDQLLAQHKQRWERLWSVGEVEISGDDKAMEALNYSLYHLNSIAPRHTESLSIPARGLSGQTYKGAVFWDTEMFMLDFFLLTDPGTARALLRYRVDTLEGALEKAKHYGFEGAFYAWESQKGGYDACTDYNVTDVFTGRPMRTYFKDKQVHISAAVVYGIMKYVDWTGDQNFLDEAALRTIVECGRFYYSLLVKRVGKENYEIWDVIGPDEYHERVNNNYYTNRMAKFVFESALQALDLGYSGSDHDLLKEKFKDALAHLYLPSPSGEQDHNKVIPQFDGYFDLEDCSLEDVRGRLLNEREYWGGAYGVASQTQIIKQADVVTALSLFPEDEPEEVLQANFRYYEPRTEHGSSLSAGMYSMLACRIHQPDKAYPFFMKTAQTDLAGGSKQWAGLVYIGGTHPAAAGAAYMTAIFGFAGLTMKNGRPECHPCLPKGISGMKFKLFCKGIPYQVEIDGERCSVLPISGTYR